MELYKNQLNNNHNFSQILDIPLTYLMIFQINISILEITV